MVTKNAVIGIDIGASDSYVAYVGKGIVDIVQNEVSQRKTPTLVGFTSTERLLGDTALSQIKSNAKNTCRNFKHLVGRSIDAPDVEHENFWSTCPLVKASDGFCGYDVTHKGEPVQFTATQITAMYLTKLKEVSEAWCQAKVADCVICVPSFYTDVHRQCLLDAAQIAGLSVLKLMNEHTATALSYGIYRSNEFEESKPTTTVFCSMGHTLFSVCCAQFVKGKLNMIAERWDKVGGRDMDECLMRVFSAQFKKKVGCDPLSNKKAAFKLEDAVTKTKKILSANNEAGVNVECLMEDEDFSSNITRADFEEMCAPMISKVKKVLDDLKEAIKDQVQVADIDFVEMVGGSCRVPWVKELCKEAFGKELSNTLNADESVARGCALQAAILSPLYKVRDFKVEDTVPHAINVSWMGAAMDADAPKEDDGETNMTAGEGEVKTVTLFPANSMSNLLKMLTFWRKSPFEMKVSYANPESLPAGTSANLGTYKFDVPAQKEPQKIKVKAKLTVHGTFMVESAQLVEEEEYEEKVKEKREIPPTPEEEAAAAAAAAAETNGTKEGDDKPAEGDAKPAEEAKKEEKKKEPEKKYEWVEVSKKKKRTKRTDVPVKVEGAPGLSPTELQQAMDLETKMQAEMKELIECGEKRNDLESYILNMRDKCSESGDLGGFVDPAQREKFLSDLMAAEDWLYDHMDDGKLVFIEKLEELKKTGDPIVWRSKESGMREQWVEALKGTIQNYKVAAEEPGDKFGHIDKAKLDKIIEACNNLECWISDQSRKQEKLQKWEKPVLVCADMEKKNMELAKMADDILKEPKPAPPKEEKKEEEAPAEAPKEEAPKEEAPKADMDVD